VTDPYRQAAHLRCLICKDGPLETDGDGFRCPHGCGLWDPSIPRPDGKSLAQHGRAVEMPVHPRTCPVCSKRMEIRRWSRLTYDVCAGHGVWVAGDDVDYYRQLTR
jgi:hypothetical protein